MEEKSTAFFEILALDCPNCGLEVDVPLVRYLHAPDHSQVAEWLLGGRLGLPQCSRCGHSWDASSPLIYDDPTRNLVVYVADSDRPTLINEFHAFLEILGDTVLDDCMARIKRVSYQIVIGVAGLRMIVLAVDKGAPFLSSFPRRPRPADPTLFLEIAYQYATSGYPEAAYDSLVRSGDLMPFCEYPDVARELGGYAFAARDYAAAETALMRAEELRESQAHRWVPVAATASGGQVPSELLPSKLLMSETEHIFTIQVGVGADAEILEARRAGMLLGELDRAIVYLGPVGQLTLFQYTVGSSIDRWCSDEKCIAEKSVLADASRTQRAQAWPPIPGDLTADQLLRMAQVFISTEERSRAKDALRQVVINDDADIAGKAHLELGKLLQRDDVDSAMAEFEMASTCPSVATASEALGYMAVDLHERPGSDAALRETLNRAVALGHPHFGPRAMLMLAEFEAEQGQVDLATRYLSRLVEAEPPSTVPAASRVRDKAALRLGLLYLESRRYSQARETIAIASRASDREVAAKAEHVLTWLDRVSNAARDIGFELDR